MVAGDGTSAGEASFLPEQLATSRSREALINSVFQEVGADFSVLLRQIGVSRADIAISRLPPTFRTQLGCQVPTTNGEPAPNLPGQTG
jgi:hypothetical protein